MSCKDCLHYEVCDCAGEYQYPQGYCKFFKDKSEWKATNEEILN